MQTHIPQAENLISEFVFTTSRSGGPGGQNVNKVNSKVTLKFDLVHSVLLSAEQKDVLLNKLASKLTKEGLILITAQDKRTQLENKRSTLAKLNQLFVTAFKTKKKRKPTAPGKAAKQARINEKKLNAEKKQWRQKP
jgi:ribosome-associated protein